MRLIQLVLFLLAAGLPAATAAGPSVGSRCKTPEHLQAFRARIAASATGTVAAVGGRPMRCSGCTVCSGSIPVCVHYESAGKAGKADDVLGYLEESWEIQVNQIGFLAPPSDGNLGGGGELDVYLSSIGSYEAYVMPEADDPSTPWADSASHMVIDENLPDSYTRSYVAHELNHVLQFAYDYLEADNIYEATSTFIEDHVYPNENDYAETIEGFQDYPERALDYATYSDWYMYGSAMFLFYLSERYDGGDPGIIEDVWNRSRQNSTSANEPDYFDAISEILAEKGTFLQDAYAELLVWQLMTGDNASGEYFSEGASWADVWINEFRDLGSANGLGSEYFPMELGGNFVEFHTANGTSDDRLLISLDGRSSKSWQLQAVGLEANGDVCIASQRSDSDGAAQIYVDRAGTFRKLYVIFGNLGQKITNPQSPPLRDPDNDGYGTSDYSWDVDYATDATTISVGGADGCKPPIGGGGGDDDDDDDNPGSPSQPGDATPRSCLCAVSPRQPARTGSMLLALAFVVVSLARRRNA